MKFHRADNGLLLFRCPCGDIHQIDPARWQVTDPDGPAPTVTPSLLVTSGHYVENRQGEDSTHALAGQTVPLPDVGDTL